LGSFQRGKDWFTKTQVADTGAGTLLELGEIRLRILLDDLIPAIQWSLNCQWLPEDTLLGYLQAVMLVRLRLAQIRQKMEKTYLREGLEITDRLLAAAEARQWWGNVLELSLLRAMLCQAQADDAGARFSLARALTVAEPEGHIRVFVDEGEPMQQLLLDYQGFIKRKIGGGVDTESLRFLAYTDQLLAAFSPPDPRDKAKPERLLEPLSKRERDILQLIATGRSNQEIAEILVIAISTVKSHINHLYGKLGTNRRTQAIAIARDLGLLSE
jgi:LuxR family maltose regulon positive regulatory protein